MTEQMSPEELKAWRETYMLSQAKLATLLGVHPTTLERWEWGKARIPNMVPLALETLAGQRATIAKRLRAQRLANKIKVAGMRAQQRKELAEALGLTD